MVLPAPFTLQFSVSNPSSTSGRGETCPEQDMNDSWGALNNARVAPRAVPISPSLSSALLVLLPRLWASGQQPKPLQTGAGVRLEHRKPSVPAWLCPAVTCRLSQRKERLDGKMTGKFGKAVPPCP